MPTESKSLAGNPDVKLYGYGIEALYHFLPGNRFVPFVAAGVGNTHYSGSGGIGDRNKLTVDYGAGLKFFLTENLALRADVRHVNPFNDHYNELLYTVGLNFAFGGAKKALPEVMATRAEPAAPVKVVKDTDGDGVVDDLDKCPGTPAGVKVDQDGCPPPVVQKAVPQAASAMETAIVEKGRVTLNVEFDTAKSTIRKSSQEEIGNLAAVMKKYTDLKILIEGHTDNVGGAKYNEKLSQQRADAIKKNLVEKYGIDASRLNTKGYGLTKPVASNATKEGRQKNRRVEAAAEYIIKK